MNVRRIMATAVLTAAPLTGVTSVLAAQPAAAQFVVPGSGTSGVPNIYYAPDNSTTEIYNYGSGDVTYVDDPALYDDGYWGGHHHGQNFDFPWWQDDWSWHHGWDGGWGGWDTPLDDWWW